jgi:hypothetical protein
MLQGTWPCLLQHWMCLASLSHTPFWSSIAPNSSCANFQDSITHWSESQDNNKLCQALESSLAINYELPGKTSWTATQQHHSDGQGVVLLWGKKYPHPLLGLPGHKSNRLATHLPNHGRQREKEQAYHNAMSHD